MTSRIRVALALSLTLALGAAAPARADEAAAAVLATPVFEDGLSGRDIYGRVVANRFGSFVQESRLTSADRAGHVQETRLQMIWRDYTSGEEPERRGVRSKTLVKYTYPFDLRHSGYLVIHNEGRTPDQFVYFPSKRKVLRVNLRSEAIAGTDFSFEDVIPGELGDADYVRQADAVVDDLPVYVVEAIPKETADSEYSKFVFFIDRNRFVPLRTRYWDEAGVEVKELRANPSAIEQHDGIWVPLEVTMRNLLLETHTVLQITSLQANPELPPTTFELRRLEAH